MKNLLFTFIAVIGLGLSSCSDSVGGCDVSDINDATTRIMETQQALQDDPESEEKCNAYKSALENYVNELDGCSLVTQASIDSYRSSLDDLEC